MQTYEALRAMKGRGVATMPMDLAVGQVVRVDGMKYRVQEPPTAAESGTIVVAVYSEDNQHDSLFLSGRRPVRVIGEVA